MLDCRHLFGSFSQKSLDLHAQLPILLREADVYRSDRSSDFARTLAGVLLHDRLHVALILGLVRFQSRINYRTSDIVPRYLVVDVIPSSKARGLAFEHFVVRHVRLHLFVLHALGECKGLIAKLRDSVMFLEVDLELKRRGVETPPSGICLALPLVSVCPRSTSRRRHRRAARCRCLPGASRTDASSTRKARTLPSVSTRCPRRSRRARDYRRPRRPFPGLAKLPKFSHSEMCAHSYSHARRIDIACAAPLLTVRGEASNSLATPRACQ